MEIKEKDLGKISRHIKLLKMFLVFILGVTLSVGYLLIEMNDDLKTQVNDIRGRQAEELRSQIMKISEDARLDGQNKVDQLNLEVTEAYSILEKEQLSKDVESYFNGEQVETPFNKIMFDYAKNKTFNVDSDNNDPFEVTLEWSYTDGRWIPIIKVNGDFSINCLSPFPRTISEEVVKQFAKGLVHDALYNAVVRGEKMTIWSFNPPTSTKYTWYHEVENMQEANLDILIELYKKHDNNIEVLRSFEFLQATPINATADILGNDRVVGGSMTNTKSKMIFYFNNFNYNEQVASCYPEFKSKIEAYDAEVKRVIIKNIQMKRLYLFIMVINVILVVIFSDSVNTHKKTFYVDHENISEKED